jgi:hypothetical protein
MLGIEPRALHVLANVLLLEPYPSTSVCIVFFRWGLDDFCWAASYNLGL